MNSSFKSGAGLIVGHRPPFELAIKQSSKPFTSDTSTKLWIDLWIIPRVRLGIMLILKIKKSEKTKSQIAFLPFLPDAFLFMRFFVYLL